MADERGVDSPLAQQILQDHLQEKFGNAATVRFDGLLGKHAEHRMTLMLISALMKGKQLQSKVRLAGLKAIRIEIKSSLLPEVALRFE